jgi:hypothetical protein
MVRQRKFKAGDKVQLNKLSVEQTEKTPVHNKIQHIYSQNQIGEIIRPEAMIPENSNFRYSVKFENETLTLNENQIELVGNN